MAGIIEVFGSPGVGKTTICKAVDARWKNSSNWIPANQVFPPLKSNHLLSRIKYKLLDSVIQSSGIDTSKIKAAEKKFVANHPQLIDAYWKNIFFSVNRNTKGQDIRFDKVKSLQNRIQKIQFITDFQTEKLCLVDEGIVHMIPGAIYKQDSIDAKESEIIDVLQLCPLPLAIINIDTDTKEIAHRLSRRNKVIPMHQNLSKSELESITQLSKDRKRIITDILERIGIPILRIDSGLNTKQNAEQIISFISDELPNKLNKGDNKLNFEKLICKKF
jgi:deoxyadenosine/deoxycytidine kinase